MTTLEQIEDLVERGVIRFAMVGFSSSGDRRHASLSLCSHASLYAQGYGATADEALLAAIGQISVVQSPRSVAPRPQETKTVINDPLADILG